eukprot:Clim_evm82s142 gene=Clim_evmTU82s142
MTFDVQFSRDQFPPKCWSGGYAFMENAGGSYVPQTVIDSIVDYMSGGTMVQPGYAYPGSARAGALMQGGRDDVAEWVGVDVEELVIVPSTSIATYTMSRAYGALLKEGDEIIVALNNHEANSGAWRRLEKEVPGVKIVDWPVDAKGTISIDKLKSLLNKNTKIVAFPHASNLTGELNDIKEISRLAHEVGAVTFVDGVAGAPHRKLQLREWDCDFYSFSFYKIMGPHMACLYGKKENLVKAPNQSHYFFPETNTLYKLNPAGPQHDMVACLSGVVQYFKALADHHGVAWQMTAKGRTIYDIIEEYEEALCKKFVPFVNGHPNLSLLGTDASDRKSRVCTFGIRLKDTSKTAKQVYEELAKEGIGCSSGHFYGRRLLEAINLPDPDDGIVRISMLHYNTLAEVDTAISGLQKILG